jgi:hypothetical protein
MVNTNALFQVAESLEEAGVHVREEGLDKELVVEEREHITTNEKI